jgi:hypothetical protein
MLNATQRATLRADIVALSQTGQPLQTAIATEDYQFIANYYNASPVTQVMGWNTETPTSAIIDAITWTSFTPTDTTDGTAIQTNRALVIGIKQFNLQNLINGRTTIDASKAGIRAGLRDSVIAIPAGTNGALISAGGTSGVNVLNACTRISSRLEIMFASAPVSTGTVSAVIYTVQGAIGLQEISDVWGGLLP